MKKILMAVRSALREKNYYAALFTTLALPDICVAIEQGRTNGDGYASWWVRQMSQYTGFLSGNDCYALRCAALHQGKDDITDQRKKEVLDYYVFLAEGPHCNLVQDCIIHGEKVSFLQLNVNVFCEDVCAAIEKWMPSVSVNPDANKRLQETIEIHENGYSRGGIRFG